MSHFVRIRTILRERDVLKQALGDLQCSFQEGEGLEVRGDSRRTEPVEIVVRTGCRYDIGFRRSGDEYEIVADWYWIEQETVLRRREFLEELTRRYAYRLVLDQAREQNLVVEEETSEAGGIVIILSERG